MITYQVYKPYSNGTVYMEGMGLSTDTKPTENVANASSIFEMDTGTVNVYDEENQTWRTL